MLLDEIADFPHAADVFAVPQVGPFLIAAAQEVVGVAIVVEHVRREMEHAAEERILHQDALENAHPDLLVELGQRRGAEGRTAVEARCDGLPLEDPRVGPRVGGVVRVHEVVADVNHGLKGMRGSAPEVREHFQGLVAGGEIKVGDFGRALVRGAVKLVEFGRHGEDGEDQSGGAGEVLMP